VPRVSCVECQGPVVVDPQGRCPEGHFVGTSGARVEQAMGNSSPHPDEPEPWVYTILPEHLEGDAAPLTGRRAATAPIGHPREARPVQVPGMAATAVAEKDPAADALLRELHSLGALDDLAEERESAAEQPPPPPATEVSDPAPAPAPRPAPLPRPDSASIADAFAELSALDSSDTPTPAPSRAPSGRSAPAPSPTHSPSAGRTAGPSSAPAAPTSTQVPTSAEMPTGADDHAVADDFASLFGDPIEPPSPPPVATGSAGDAHAGETQAPPAPETGRGTLRAVPNTPPTPSVSPDTSSEAPGGAAGDVPSADPAPAPAPAATLDLSNFTAKGGATGRNGRGKGRWSRR